MSERRPFGPEGPECEWKQRAPRADRLARTLAAFHNGAGGRLWIGVADDGRLVGVEDVGAVRAAVERAAERVEPAPRIAFSRRRVGEALLLEVRVAPGAAPAAVGGPDGARRVYVRDGASSRPASAAQARLLVRGQRRAPSLDPRARRLLAALACRGPLRRAELARALRVGERTCRRTLVPLIDAGLVMEAADRRLSLTPRGHRRA